MGSVRTSILGGPRPLSSDRRAQPDYTLSCEEPVNRPGEFDGITTRIDALYFTLTTMTTTGYGDITAVGQLARVLVSAVFVFDLVFLGLIAAELSRLMSRRRRGDADPENAP